MIPLKVLANYFMLYNDRNFYANGIDLRVEIFGNPVEVESIWSQHGEDKVYIHCGCKEFEGDIDIESLSDSNQEILRKVFEENI